MPETIGNSAPPISGTALALIQFAACEELRLDVLQQAANARPVHQPRVKPNVPSYVHYERPPLTEPLDALVLENGERLGLVINFR